MNRDTWRHVVPFLASFDVCVLCQVNRTLRALVRPWRYRHIAKSIHAMLARRGLDATVPWPIGLGLSGFFLYEALVYGRDTNGLHSASAQLDFHLPVSHFAQGRLADGDKRRVVEVQAWFQRSGWEIACVCPHPGLIRVRCGIHFLPRERLAVVTAASHAEHTVEMSSEYVHRVCDLIGLSMPEGTLMVTNSGSLNGSAFVEIYDVQDTHVHDCGAAVMHGLPHFHGHRVCIRN